MIQNINGVLFKNMLFGASQMLQNNKKLVDSLNVFPVPDGDTGTNMSMTMTSVVNELKYITTDNMSDIAGALSRGALKGARGNSGVILSQILKGIALGLSKSEEINSKAFAEAMKKSTEIAYSAVTKPKEGTILTVIRMMTEYAISITAHKTIDLDDMFEKVITRGEEVLNQTPDMLPVLKKAGVVDAGGKGLIFIFQGMHTVLIGGEIPVLEEEEHLLSEFEELTKDDDVDYENIKFAYCTEFFVKNLYPKVTEADIDKLRDLYMTIGDCVIVIGDLQLVKVHVHTNQPDIALKAALVLGELDGVKIENMLMQNRAIKEKKKKEKERPRKKMGMISICAGSGVAQIFDEFGVDIIVEGGQTMNPSVEDILQAIKDVNSDNVFILPNNKNIILAAKQAKELAECNVYVIPTTNIPQGISCSLAFNPEEEPDYVEKAMVEEIDRISCGQVTYAVRNTKIDGFNLKEGDIIGLDGKRIVAKGNHISKVVEDVVAKLVNDDMEMITLYFGENVKEADANKLVESLQEKYEDFEVACYYGGQPHYYYLIGLE